jgi:hypothetical protein
VIEGDGGLEGSAARRSAATAPGEVREAGQFANRCGAELAAALRTRARANLMWRR